VGVIERRGEKEERSKRYAVRRFRRASGKFWQPVAAKSISARCDMPVRSVQSMSCLGMAVWAWRS